jgi:hypothetical protein
MQAMQNWIEKHKKAFYIQISEQYKTCGNLNEFITK